MEDNSALSDPIGAKDLGFFSSCSLKMREKYINFAQFVSIFLERSVFFTFQFLNDKFHNYVFFDIIVNFIIQKLKSKRTSLNIQTEQN